MIVNRDVLDRSICICVWLCNEGRDIPVCVSGRMDCHADYGRASFSAQLWASEARRECCDLRRIYRILDMNDREK
jgi:hypothetical protein